MHGARSVAAFAAALGSASPTPGGGAASAVVGALAAALAEMVGQLTVARHATVAQEDAAQALISHAQELRRTLLALVDDDAEAYEHVAATYRMPRDTDAERVARAGAIQEALLAAMQPPLRVMECACEVLAVALRAAQMSTARVASDAGCAALCGEAAVRAGALNVLANAVLLRDARLASEASARAAALQRQAADVRARALATVYARMGVADPDVLRPRDGNMSGQAGA